MRQQTYFASLCELIDCRKEIRERCDDVKPYLLSMEDDFQLEEEHGSIIKD